MKGEARVLAIRGRRFTLGPRVWLMGVLNVTPDSFSDGGAYRDPGRAIDHGQALAAEGADIIDVGGESTRPGARPVPEDEEMARVIPVVRALRPRIPALISVDTTKAAVARAALDAGADIVNDTSALRADPAMAGVVAAAGAGLVLMHMQGTPLTMQDSPHYDDLMGEILGFLDERVRAAAAAGIPAERVIVDPGIGFGKTFEHNLEILRGQGTFRRLGRRRSRPRLRCLAVMTAPRIWKRWVSKRPASTASFVPVMRCSTSSPSLPPGRRRRGPGR